MSAESQFEIDRRMARERGCRFFVTAKENRDSPWKRQAERLEDLKDAMILTTYLRAERSAIHIDRNGCGVLYWSSDAPDVLNSRAISNSTP